LWNVDGTVYVDFNGVWHMFLYCNWVWVWHTDQHGVWHSLFDLDVVWHWYFLGDCDLVVRCRCVGLYGCYFDGVVADRFRLGDRSLCVRRGVGSRVVRTI